MIPSGRRGLSNIIAVMFLIVISVTGSFVLYAYASGIFGQLQAAQPKQSYTDQIALEFYDWTDSSSTHTLKLQIRNVGSTNIQIVDIFISGTRVINVTWGTPPDTCNGGYLPVQRGCYVQLTTPVSLISSLRAGFAYPVSFITSSGAKVSFSAVFEQTG